MSSEFYRHKIITAEDFSQFASAPAEAQHSGKIKIMRATDYGMEAVDTDKLIFIHYRDGKLLVNQEIADQYPSINYRSWLARRPPESGSVVTSYPLRGKFVFAPDVYR